MLSNACGHDWIVEITQQEEEYQLDQTLLKSISELESFSRFAVYINKYFSSVRTPKLLNHDTVLELLNEHEIACVLDKVSHNKVRITRNAGVVTTYLPIYFMGKVIGVLIVETTKELEERESMIAIYMLNVYANQLSLLHKSQLDPLTELLNRQTFEKKVIEISTGANQLTVADSSHNCWYLAMLDIDHFKQVNDTYGHVIGDEVILLVAQLLKNNFRLEDYIFRYGGEEFAVLFPATDELDAKNSLERFRLCVAEYPFPQVGQLTISIGLLKLDEMDMVASLVHKADLALYHSKHNGRNRVTCYSDLNIVEQEVDEDAIELF